MKIDQNVIERYLQLPYTVTLRRDEEGDWIARIQEFAGCTAHGQTKAEALENLEDVQRVWVEDALESGDPIPEPRDEEVLPSGRWLQRVPRSLHGKLASAARQENVSLNQLVTSILAEAMGRRTVEPEAGSTVHPELRHSLWDFDDPVQSFWYSCSSVNSAAYKKLLLGWMKTFGSKWEIQHPPTLNPLYAAIVTDSLADSAHLLEQKRKVSESGKKEELRHKAYYAKV